jgi:hypothetical protein
MTTLPVKESDIERTCSEYLQWDGWRVLKTDPVSNRGRGKGFGEIGMADCLYIRYLPYLSADPAAAEVLWIEWKRPKNKLTPAQIAWHTAERARGAKTAAATWDFPPTIDGFIEWYQRSGLRRSRKP